MNKSFIISNIVLKILSGSLIFLPTPINISIFWNFGSILGLMLMIQILSGLFLSFHYCPQIDLAFNSIVHIMQDVQYGWLIRVCHANGASMFFIALYSHIGRGIYYNSFLLKTTWFMGVIIYFLCMMTAFMGYILPWGQMSFWGATVITNLISAIPYLGEIVVKWLWGGFSINNATLNRFFSFYFILPFIILFGVFIHLFFLHQSGSSNSLGTNSNLYKISFHSYFSIKDLMGYFLMFLFLFMLMYFSPYLLSDPDNFIPANSSITPPHIQPEWYFLFAHTILRSIPNKLGGVIALALSIFVLFLLPFINMLVKSLKFNFLFQLFYWIFVNVFIILTFLGAKPIEYPYVLLGQFLAVFYFLYFYSYSYSFKWMIKF